MPYSEADEGQDRRLPPAPPVNSSPISMAFLTDVFAFLCGTVHLIIILRTPTVLILIFPFAKYIK